MSNINYEKIDNDIELSQQRLFDYENNTFIIPAFVYNQLTYIVLESQYDISLLTEIGETLKMTKKEIIQVKILYNVIIVKRVTPDGEWENQWENTDKSVYKNLLKIMLFVNAVMIKNTNELYSEVVEETYDLNSNEIINEGQYISVSNKVKNLKKLTDKLCDVYRNKYLYPADLNIDIKFNYKLMLMKIIFI
jgi:hypothetical protein